MKTSILIRKVLVLFGAIAVVVTGLTVAQSDGQADARTRTWYDLPDRAYSDGDAQLVSLRRGRLRNTATVKVRWERDSRSRYCTYVQYKWAVRFGVDTRAKRLTGNRCVTNRTGTSSYRFSTPWATNYTNLRFRVCQDIPRRWDRCGSWSGYVGP